MPGKKSDPASSLNDQLDEVQDPRLLEAVNQLVWFITDEFVEATQEAMWLEEMLPEPTSPKKRIASKS